MTPVKKADSVEKEYFDEVELTDPITGKKFKQKLKITRYKAQDADKKSILEELEDDSAGVLPDVDLEADEE